MSRRVGKREAEKKSLRMVFEICLLQLGRGVHERTFF